MRAEKIKEEQEQLIAATDADTLIEQCIERLMPILTHKKEPSYMSIPVNYERDDDVFVITRLREVVKRLRLEQ